MSPRVKIAYTVVDAFTSVPFQGNPAAVVLLGPQYSQTFDDKLLQKIAAEFNISETAFVTPVDGGGGGDDGAPGTFSLRWFTPTTEVPLCGHATLATSRVLFDKAMGLAKSDGDVLTYRTISGEMKAKKLTGAIRESASESERDQIELEFPACQTVPAEDRGLVNKVERILQRAFGIGGGEVGVGNVRIAVGEAYKGFALVEVNNEFNLEGVKAINISAFEELGADSITAVVITSTRPSASNPNSVFISRTFAPLEGIAEDPVCGAAHCMLAPYWSEKLNIPLGQVINARQVSPRGGDVDVVFDKERGVVRLRGCTVVVQQGEMYL